MSISEQIQHSTIRIESKLANGSISTGTGFFFEFLKSENGHCPVIITNKHVVKGAMEGKFIFTISKEGKPDYGNNKEVIITDFEQSWINHPDDTVDLCAMPIGELILNLKSQGIEIYFVKFDKSLIPTQKQLEELMALEDATMFGYPNGIWDSLNNLPVMRRAITATHPKIDYRGKQEFLIDAACFPGSSGSPVLILNQSGYHTTDGMAIGSRVFLLGVLYAVYQHNATGIINPSPIPIPQTHIAHTSIPNNLGIVLKANRIIELELEVKKTLNL